MKHYFTLILLLVAGICLIPSCKPNNSGSTMVSDYNTIPLPHDITVGEGSPFVLSGTTTIVYPEGNEKMQRNAEFLAEFIEMSTGIKPSLEVNTTNGADQDAPENIIILSTGLSHDNKEAYRIEIDTRFARINGASEAAVFHGIQTLRKAIPVGNYGSIALAPVTINDFPRFGHRGMMLDVAHHFQPVSFVKKFIDLLALHNLNRFHWH